MPVDELKIQRDIILEVQKLGGFAFKMSNRFLVGVPDLFIKMPGYDTTIVEVKFVRAVANPKKIRLPGPSVPQANFMKKAGAAGVPCYTWRFIRKASRRPMWAASIEGDGVDTTDLDSPFWFSHPDHLLWFLHLNECILHAVKCNFPGEIR